MQSSRSGTNRDRHQVVLTLLTLNTSDQAKTIPRTRTTRTAGCLEHLLGLANRKRQRTRNPAVSLADLQQAANEVVAGDTVIVEPGDYAGFALGYENPQTGTASAPITWKASPGVVIDAPNPYTADGIDLEGASYINIEGFTVDNTSGTITRAGIRSVTNTNVLIEDNTAENCGRLGESFSGFSNNLRHRGQRRLGFKDSAWHLRVQYVQQPGNYREHGLRKRRVRH